MAARRFERYVAIGDSSTEGLDDPDGRGGFRGWANRLAERIAASQGGLLYANLAVRGRRTRAVRDEQLDRAVALRPDLATVFCGTNDVVARRFDADAFAADLDAMVGALAGGGATVLTFTMPDLAAVMPAARGVAPRLATLNGRIRAVAARHDARLVDFERHPVAADPRLWSDDRLHANASGHARIAAALAHALALPGADDAWQEPLPPAPRLGTARRIADELAWTRRHLLPWLWRHLRGRSAGDGRSAKRPELLPLAAEPAA
ncbi:MAG: SGNH/GDSL hydrolase family protein [Thermoanaerobaculia bacterium]|nr:SGNH/GDSL hydrolase family protein [Thermoanaerobaculia bacterium]